MDDIIEKLKKQIEEFKPTATSEKIGVVTSVGDGIAVIEGLDDAVMSEMIVFDTDRNRDLEEIIDSPSKVIGMILNLEDSVVKAVVLGDTHLIKEGTVVKSTGSVLDIPVSDDLLGKVINPLGETLDGSNPVKADKRYPIENRAYGVIERKSVDTPLHTGIKSIDAMVPIGRGQRELIIGDRQTGKTVIAIDAILNQMNEPTSQRPICIYVAIGQKESKVAKIVHDLKERGAMEYTIVVSAPSSAPAALQFLAPYTGAAIGEFFMDQGKDALVIYDDLSKHAVAYRQMSLLLRRPPGREAYPGDIFYLHSRLLERAAKLNDSLGGGSLTALPIIETQEGDVSAYIPTNVISITDGQIYLDANLFNKGIMPAIDVGLSVSRVGSAAQTKAMKKVAGKLRLELAQFRELEAFAQFSQDLDPETKKRIDSGKLMVEILKQDKNVPLGFEKQVSILYLAVNGNLEGIHTNDVQKTGADLLNYLENQEDSLLKTIKEEKAISNESAELLEKAAQRVLEK